MLNYEVAEVKKYESVNKTTGKVRVKSQVNIPKGSKFSEPKPVALVDVAELENFINSNDVANFNELEGKYNNTSEELNVIKQQLQESKATVKSLSSEVKKLKEENENLKNEVEEYKEASKSLASDVHKLREEKVQLQEDLLNVEDKNEEIIQLQQEHKEELKEATDKIEKLLIMINKKDNDIVYLAKRGLGSRIRNRLTPRIKATIIEVEATEVKDQPEE